MDTKPRNPKVVKMMGQNDVYMYISNDIDIYI